MRRHRFAGAIAIALGLVAAAATAARPAAAGRFGVEPCDSSDFTLTRLFDRLPVDLSTISGIIPLGNVNGDTHVVPISTIYFQSPGDVASPTYADTPILAPGDVTVTGLRWEPNSGGSLEAGDDWYVNFRPCQEIRFTFHHLNAITGPPALVARARQIRRGVNAWCTYDDATGAATSCSGVTNLRVRSGTELGSVFRHNQTSFNFTAFDTRDPSTFPPPPPGDAVDPSRYVLTYADLTAALSSTGTRVPHALTPDLYDELDPSRTHARCALDYFEPALRGAMEAKLGSYDGSILRTALPLCGQVFQDNLDGGLTGGWFPEGLVGTFLLDPESTLAAFLSGNVDPLKLYFSIGTDVAPALGRVVSFPYPGFDLAGSTYNRSFKGAFFQPSLPVASQPVYCWDGLFTAETAGGASMPAEPVTGVMLVQFTSATRMRFEYESAGTCVAAPPFTSEAKYFVR